MRSFFAAATAAVFLALTACALISASPLDEYYSDSLEKAAAAYASETWNDKNNKMNFYDLASVLKEFGRNKEALEAYTALITADTNEQRAHFELAKTYYFLGGYISAEEELRKLASKNIVNWELYYWWGCILMEEGKLDEAMGKFNGAVDADKYKNITYVKIGELYEKKNDIPSAIASYKLAIKYDKIYTELNLRLARLYEKKHDAVNSYVYWKKLGDMDTKDGVAAQKVRSYLASIPFLMQKNAEWKNLRKETRLKQVPPERKNVRDSSNIPDIKVGLMEDARAISFKCGSNFDLVNDRYESIYRGEKMKEYYFEYDKVKKEACFGDGIQKIYFDRDMYLTRDNPESTTTVYNVQYGEGFYWAEKKDTNYRGDFEVRCRDKALILINLVNIEEYLYGVVPSEIPPTWPAEALKAQAVAARTYTFQHLERHSGKGYDVCSSQHCAVYSGVTGEYKYTNKAVEETRGEVLFGSNYKMLNTFYSHCCGGHTQDVNEVWGLKRVASLGGAYDGKREEWNFPLSPFFLEEWVRTSPDVYCRADGAIETSFRWIRYLDADSLEYYLNRNNDIGKVMDIRPLRRAKGGALTKVLITGDRGSKTFGFDSMRNVLGKIRSNVIKWEYKKDENGYIKEMYIYGAGWGHGVGMCQRGIKGMAEDRQGYESILYHYYPGSYIKSKY